MKKTFPKRIAVTVYEGGDESGLLAWKSVAQADDGKVAVYELVDEFDKKDVPHLRRKGTKAWFKAGG